MKDDFHQLRIKQFLSAKDFVEMGHIIQTLILESNGQQVARENLP